MESFTAYQLSEAAASAISTRKSYMQMAREYKLTAQHANVHSIAACKARYMNHEAIYWTRRLRRLIEARAAKRAGGAL